MSLQTPGLLCMQRYTSGTALVVAFLQDLSSSTKLHSRPAPARILGQQAQLPYAS